MLLQPHAHHLSCLSPLKTTPRSAAPAPTACIGCCVTALFKLGLLLGQTALASALPLSSAVAFARERLITL